MASFDLSNSNNAWVPPSFSSGQWGSMDGLISGWNNMGAQNNMAPAVNAITKPATTAGLAPATPGGAGADAGGSSGFGFNMDTGKLLLGGLQTIGSLWNAWESQKLAKKTFAFQKDVTETNLRNQIQSYNTTLEDRGRSRAHAEGQDAGTAQAYVDNNRLKR